MEAYNNKGQSFFEVIVAMTLISLVLIAIVSLASLSIRASVFSRNQTTAARFSEQATEWLQGEKDANWSTFYSHASSPIYCLDSLYWQKQRDCAGADDIISGTPFTRVATFTINSVSSVTVNVTTRWIDAQGSHSVPSSIVLTSGK